MDQLPTILCQAAKLEQTATKTDSAVKEKSESKGAAQALGYPNNRPSTVGHVIPDPPQLLGPFSSVANPRGPTSAVGHPRAVFDPRTAMIRSLQLLHLLLQLSARPAPAPTLLASAAAGAKVAGGEQGLIDFAFSLHLSLRKIPA